MKYNFLALLMLGGCLTAYAQQTSTGTASDTARTAAETSARSAYAPGEVITPEGKRVQAYFPNSVNGFEKTISYYYSHPEVRPFPKPHFISVDKILSMTVRGQYSETLKINGKSLGILAARLADGPVELFNFAEAKSVPLPLPVPGAAFVPIAGIPYTKNHWYLRQNGVVTEVKRGKFEEQISQYLSARPELAAKIRAKADGYHYQDMVRIINEYNQPAGSTSN